jgi:hypothetical protein
MNKNYTVEVFRHGSSCEETMHVNFDEVSVVDDVKAMLKEKYGNDFDRFTILDNHGDLYHSELKHYEITIHYKNDPNDNRMQICGLETDDLESAKEFVLDEFGGGIDYYVIEDTEGDDYYDSSEEVSLKENNDNINKEKNIMKEEKTITSMKERVENFHNSEIELKSAIIDEIKSEFEKYHSDKVSIFHPDFNDLGFEDYECLIPTLNCFDDNCCSEPTQPICFKKEKDNLVVECDNDKLFYLYPDNYDLTVDNLYSFLALLQHFVTKKVNKK